MALQKEKPERRFGKEKRISNFLIGASEEEKRNWRSSCQICKKDPHDVEDCKVYMSLDVGERSKRIFKCRLCYCCLKPISTNHNAATCKMKKICKLCNKEHPTSLHCLVRRTNQRKPDPKDKVGCSLTRTDAGVVSMCIVPVEVSHPSSKKIISTFAMLDSCSQGTFVAEDVIQRLSITGKQTTLTIKTINGEKEQKSEVFNGIQVRSQEADKSWINLSKSYAQKELPVDESDIITPQQREKWRYLADVVKDVKTDKNIEVGLLIGANCPAALEQLDIIPSQHGGPYAFKTKLGWCVVGPVNGNSEMKLKVNKIAVQGADSK